MTEPAPAVTEQDRRYFCYMVRCNNGAFYTGWTTDPVRRVKMHNSGQGAAYTKMHCPVILVYVETLTSRRAAMCREREIKKFSHAKKQQLINAWFECQMSDC